MSKNMIVIFGGQSPEHDISKLSFRGVFPYLPASGWTHLPVYISHTGIWHHITDSTRAMKDSPPCDTPCVLTHDWDNPGRALLFNLNTMKAIAPVDFAFIVLHGANGEDGRLQGHLDMLGVPYSGCGPESAAMCMNKAVTKRLCEADDIPVVPYETVQRGSNFDPGAIKLGGGPWFVKPARTGSSVGIRKVAHKDELALAVEYAFSYDDLVLIEQAIVGRELECGVLEDPDQGRMRASVPAEIIPGDEFYSYEDKYINDKAQLICPAVLNKKETQTIQKTAIRAFEAVGGEGFARVDFFMTADGTLYFNEINPIPGFTEISMFPRMFAESGLSREIVLQKIVTAGLRRAARATKA